jgi:hypothetical protein
VVELAGLKELSHLSLPLSMKDCISNMPELLYVLKEFRSLRSLLITFFMLAIIF